MVFPMFSLYFLVEASRHGPRHPRHGKAPATSRRCCGATHLKVKSPSWKGKVTCMCIAICIYKHSLHSLFLSFADLFCQKVKRKLDEWIHEWSTNQHHGRSTFLPATPRKKSTPQCPLRTPPHRGTPQARDTLDPTEKEKENTAPPPFSTNFGVL